MGYELHISRVIPWTYDRRYPIRAEEVLDLVRHAVDLDVPNRSPKSPDYFTVLVGADQWLQFSFGRLHTKHPDDELIRRMLTIADTLDAWVLGDDNDIYGLDGDELVVRPAVITDLPYPRRFITRTDPILEPEWVDTVATQPDFAWWTRIQARVPSGLKWIACPPVACWTGHPAGNPIPFFLDDVEYVIDVWQPDSTTLNRMQALASTLDAALRARR